MKWEKIIRIFCPDKTNPALMTHAAVPFAEELPDGNVKIYFTSRDKFNRSHTTFLIIDLEQPEKIIELSTKPVLSPGALGTFDDSGAMGSWLVHHNNTRYLYYIGWNLGVTVPFRNSIGLAIETAEGFKRVSEGPILDRTMKEPYFCASSCVIPSEDIWRMWYLSCTGWANTTNGVQHHYHIKYAESQDGIHWNRLGTVAIDYASPKEYALSRPCVIHEDGIWKMWFSARGDSYRIYYAESLDGKNWSRKNDSVGIDVSPSGWDSDMIEYPFVFDCKGERFMLYNGNGYGETGFGLARLV